MRLQTTRRSKIGLLATPITLGTLAALTLGADRGGVAGELWLAAAVVSLAVAAFDYPLACVIGRGGIERHCPVRSHTLGWDRISAIEVGRGHAIGVVTLEGRRYLMSDRADAIDRVAKVVATHCPSVGVRVRTPPRMLPAPPENEGWIRADEPSSQIWAGARPVR